MPKHRKDADASQKRVSRLRSSVGGCTFLVAIVTLSLLTTSATYALWSATTTVDGSSISTGSIGLSVNGATAYAIPGLDASKLAPGRSVVVAITLANTGTTPIAASTSSVTIDADINGLAGSLSLIATPVASAAACAPGLAGGTAAVLASFSTTAAPLLMAVGTSQVMCLELKLDALAPASVQNGTTVFTLNMVADQRRA